MAPVPASTWPRLPGNLLPSARAIAAIVAIAVSACDGTLLSGAEVDGGADPGADGGPHGDGAVPGGPDAAPPGADAAPPGDAPDPCTTLTCGFRAHCEAGACACNDGYEGDPLTACTMTPGTEATVRALLVEVATAELGFCEGVGEPRPYMLGQPGLWCYDFVAWVYGQADPGLPAPAWLPQVTPAAMPPDWLPEPGDLIKYTYQHYGMVAEVTPDFVGTIEGNVGGCVMRRSTDLMGVEFYGSLDEHFAGP